jgi:hypothetical protein
MSDGLVRMGGYLYYVAVLKPASRYYKPVQTLQDIEAIDVIV